MSQSFDYKLHAHGTAISDVNCQKSILFTFYFFVHRVSNIFDNGSTLYKKALIDIIPDIYWSNIVHLNFDILQNY